MSNERIRTGIIGGSLNHQWASQTHIPALRNSPVHQITAIATSKMESALQSAAALDVPLAFAGHKELSQSAEVELVVVSIRVPFHYEAVKTAILAGKNVYCEWPLAATTSQAEELAELADQAGIHHAIGLQARLDNAVLEAKRRIESGEIGRILSCTMQVSTQGKGGVTDRKGAYLLMEENGATLLTINGGHSLDVLCYLLGDFKELSAAMNSNYLQAVFTDTGEPAAKNTADQIMIHGTLKSAASVSVHIQGGAYPGFTMDIQGEKGVIRLRQQSSVGHVQFGNLQLQQAVYAPGSSAASSMDDFITVLPEKEETRSPVQNVLKAHTVLARDILDHTFQSANFHDALRLHRLLDTIRQAASTGQRLKLS
ncbi:Predicted dehydrogenase [Paenibacillus sophorae]|uniref:Gfo/Idh/MocA family oxidoreductase n=1 Tax=Paenibacillus sophorae TaxID=1333845 RepID=A0A1H8PIU9_9BACL|nr:Gfo/Idh/MocA family oxidoreductase [Paenibacillus sophorae]QWU16582.1 Gfo/Idh/MocA family oxidoreductase [Paenibacillus sophorae]SEO41493.1 Predicted dehydrogenase [Paenibacillus sophorae]